ncbi:MAG: cupin domain-containing protein [Planctomycetota bacterium]|jgi:mannose-6-phosphate isomerase-like protein (cupin superfamily)
MRLFRARTAALAASVALAQVGCGSSSKTRHDMLIMEPHEGDVLWSLHESGERLGAGGELQIYLDAETHPHARASFSRYTLGVGGALPVHRHDKTEEFAYVISGEGAAVSVDDEGNETEHRIAPGYFWYNPPGGWHTMRNKGRTPLTIVFATVPNEAHGLLSFFRRISSAPGEDPIEIPPDELDRIAAEHDMILWKPGGDQGRP